MSLLTIKNGPDGADMYTNGSREPVNCGGFTNTGILNGFDWSTFPTTYSTATFTFTGYDTFIETNGVYIAYLDVPGAKRDTVKVLHEGLIISVTAERPNVYPFFYARTFTVPVDVELDTLEARLEDGVLYLSVKKKMPPKPVGRLIQVK